MPYCPTLKVTNQLWPASGSQATGPLKGAHLWLAASPRGGVPTLVWRAVCMAAVVGLDKGRRMAWSMGHCSRPPDEVVVVSVVTVKWWW